MVWCCEKLDLEAPGIEVTPEVGEIEAQVDRYVEHVLERWREPLADVPAESFDVVHESPWGVGYCANWMLEHAVMHPIPHTFQLRKLMREQGLQ